jgi:hypothetical protein
MMTPARLPQYRKPKMGESQIALFTKSWNFQDLREVGRR